MTAPQLHRGTSLVEALVALAVLSLGVAGAVRWQGDLQRRAMVSADRAQAVRLADDQIEAWRGGLTPDIALPDVPAPFRAERHVAADSVSPWLEWITLDVHWTDRGGDDHAARLASAANRLPAALSGALAVPRGPAAGPQVLGRAPAVTVTARDLGDGRSVVVPSDAVPIAFIVDNASGRVAARCSSTLVQDCSAADGWPVSGWIRVSLATPPDALHPDDTPLPLAPAWQLTRGQPVAPGCITERREGALAYHCVIAPDNGAWSGRSEIVATGAVPFAFSVCRYVSPASDGDRNAGHPDRYEQVDRPLMQQNFLVIRAGQACPVVPASPALPDGIVTAAHQA